MNELIERYGAAQHYDFDDPQKWVTVENVPLLDEHVIKNEKGKVIAKVDRAVLETIAENNNRRVHETGDPATLILGHTDDDPKSPEKPVKGFVINYKVKPFRRDTNGKIIYAIYGDFKIRPQNKHILEEYPRRSVELWWEKKELDPIALLGGTSPERDLGVIIRKARLKSNSSSQDNNSDLQGIIRYSRSENRFVETYDLPIDYSTQYQCHSKISYKGDTMATDYLSEDTEQKVEEKEKENDVSSDPVLAKLFQSKQWKELTEKVNIIFSVIEEEIARQESEMTPQGSPPQQELPPGELPPSEESLLPENQPGGGLPPPPPQVTEKSKQSRGQEPVRFEASTALPGPSNVMTTGFPQKKGVSTISSQKFSRNSLYQSGVPMTENDRRISQIEQQNQELLLKLSRLEAEKIVNNLKQEGILFGRTPEEEVSGMRDDIEYLAHCTPELRDDYINNVIRKKYARRKPDPTKPSVPGVARYSRAEPNVLNSGTTQEFEPETPEEASYFADMQTIHKMSRQEAAQEVLKLRRKNMN